MKQLINDRRAVMREDCRPRNLIVGWVGLFVGWEIGRFEFVVGHDVPGAEGGDEISDLSAADVIDKSDEDGVAVGLRAGKAEEG